MRNAVLLLVLYTGPMVAAQVKLNRDPALRRRFDDFRRRHALLLFSAFGASMLLFALGLRAVTREPVEWPLLIALIGVMLLGNLQLGRQSAGQEA